MAIQSQKKVFCYAPWSNLEILPSGTMLPCCKFQPNAYGDAYNIKQHSLDTYMRSPMLQEVKQDFQQDRWPKGCDRCRIEEENHIHSKRQLDAQRWQQAYHDYDVSSAYLLTLSLALGNTCNLKCITCGPTASSSWAREYQDLYNIRVEPMTQYRKLALQEILQLSDSVIHLDIHGGEPFLAAQHEHLQLLDHFITKHRAAEIEIHYTTNGSIFPDAELVQRWQQFKKVDLQISIDDIGERYEYIRYPASWSVLCSNVDRFLELVHQNPGCGISVATTVSAFNILYLDDFFDWCKITGLPNPWTGRLHTPHFLRPSVWSDSAKARILKRLSQSRHIDARRWAYYMSREDNSHAFTEFVDFVKRHDQYRGINFNTVFPELKEYI